MNSSCGNNKQIFVSWSLHITKDYGIITDKMETTGKEIQRAEGKKNMELSRGEGGLGGQQWRNRLGYMLCEMTYQNKYHGKYIYTKYIIYLITTQLHSTYI
jgi:hypothetical protein